MPPDYLALKRCLQWCTAVESTGMLRLKTKLKNYSHPQSYSLGIRHDGYGNECADKTRDIPHVMASTSLRASKRGLSQWSKCSKRMLGHYLRYNDL